MPIMCGGINDEFQSVESDDRIEVVYPYDGKVWATVPNGSADDIDTAVTVPAKRSKRVLGADCPRAAGGICSMTLQI